MAGPSLERRYTYADLERMFPEEDEVRCELIDGELFMSPSVSRRHQLVVVELLVALVLWTREHGGEALTAPLDIGFTEDTVLQPDVLLVRTKQHYRFAKRPYPPPDLAVEVSSPSTRSHDRIRKRAVYERHGVPEFWLVDLDHDRVEVYRLTDGRYPDPLVLQRGDTLTSPLVPGFALALGQLFDPS